MDTELLKRRGDEGFTLLEVLIAMVILSIAVMGAQAALTDRLVRDVNREDRRTIAIQLVADRIQAIQMDPSYEQLAARYQMTESAIPNFTGYTRKTTVVQTYNAKDRVDYKTATVIVSHAQLSPAVTRTIIIAAP